MVIAVFAVGVAVGATVFSTASVDGPDGAAADADAIAEGDDAEEAADGVGTVDMMAIGCRSEVVLVVSAEELPEDTYRLRVSAGDRMFPVTEAMMHTLIGRQHPRSASPVNGRLILIAVIGEPAGPVRYELVGTETDVAEGGTQLPRALTCIDAE